MIKLPQKAKVKYLFVSRTSRNLSTFFMLCLLLSSVIAIAQDESNLLIDFSMCTVDQVPLTDALILIESKGKTFDTIACLDQCSLKLDFDGVYKISVLKSGYAEAALLFDTRSITGSNREWGYEFGGFTIELEPIAESKKPLLRAIIYYKTDTENFEYLRTKTEKRKACYYKRLMKRHFKQNE